jgi:hypothetical protein|tara:strand:- start:393 stop:548 length:156 start_codon:yes stop_codon:yes gene_type:complete
MKPRGLGDSIAKFTKKTGIKTVVQNIAGSLNKPCGCQERQDYLNKKFPYKQ